MTQFTETKSALRSKGVLGGTAAAAAGIAIMVAGVLAHFGYDVTPEEIESLIITLVGLYVSISGVVAAIGRIVASRKIAL